VRDELLKTDRYDVALTRFHRRLHRAQRSPHQGRHIRGQASSQRVHADAGPKPNTSPRLRLRTLALKGEKRIDGRAPGRLTGSLMSKWIPAAREMVNQILADLVQRGDETSCRPLRPNPRDRGRRGRLPALQNTHRKASTSSSVPTSPPILLEMGFITNADNARTMVSEADPVELVAA